MYKADVKDVLGKLIQEHYAMIRHCETQRSTASNLLVIVAAAILAFVTYDKALTLSDLPLTIMLFIIGLVGAIFCVKYYERGTINYRRLVQYRDMLDKLLFDGKLIGDLIKQANDQHRKQFPRLYEGSLNWMKVYRLWIIFHLFVSLLGLILTILALFSGKAALVQPINP